MAESGGISWGKMIKGAVKLTAIAVVGIGIITGVGFGLEALGGPEQGSTLNSIAGLGTAIVSGVGGLTSDIAAMFSDPITNLFGAASDPSTLTGRENLDASIEPKDAETLRLSEEQLAEQIQGTAAEVKTTATELVADSTSADNPGGALTQVNAEIAALDDAHQALLEQVNAYEQAYMTENGITDRAEIPSEDLAKFDALRHEIQTSGAAIESITTAGSDLEQAVEALKDLPETGAGLEADTETMTEKLNTFHGQEEHLARLQNDTVEIQQMIAELPELNDSAPLEALNENVETFAGRAEAFGQSEAVKDTFTTLADVRADVGHAYGEDYIEEAPLGWAIAGGTVAGAKIAHDIGQSRGQREVIGAFTDRLQQERAAAQMAAMQQQRPAGSAAERLEQRRAAEAMAAAEGSRA